MIQKIKRFLRMLITNPNSPEGLRMRAERIEEKHGVNNDWAKMLRKMAEMKEEKES